MPTMISGHRQVIFEKSGQAPSPSKDFHQLMITDSMVIWRSWKISLRKDQISIPPSQNKQNHEDFYYDTTVSAEIKRVFGDDVLQYVECIVNHDWLFRMKDEVLIKIFCYLDLPDIERITRVCRHFRTVCNSNDLWRSIYKMHCPSITSDIEKLAEDMGWKKMFFTNKLQLQKEASRLRRSAEAKRKEQNYSYGHHEHRAFVMES